MTYPTRSDVIREYQETTFQMPCGQHSLYDAFKQGLCRSGPFALYAVLTQRGNFESGWSHALSYSQLATYMGVPRSTVLSWMNALIDIGWVEKKVRGGNLPNTYRVIHHQCDPDEVPRDKDGLPKKCAIPMGEGSPASKLRQTGVRAYAAWLSAKIESDWITGIVKLTVTQAQHLWHMGRQTICNIFKTWERCALGERTSPRGTATVCQLYPKPYQKRRTRRHENPKGMRCDGEFYYAFNERWRVHRKTGDIQTRTQVPGASKWRYSNEGELERLNPKILTAFQPIIEMAGSPQYQQLQSC